MLGFPRIRIPVFIGQFTVLPLLAGIDLPLLPARGIYQSCFTKLILRFISSTSQCTAGQGLLIFAQLVKGIVGVNCLISGTHPPY
jgi:hypothetical protein